MYNPGWGRFINADSLGGQIGTILSHNVFAYCGNNPINREDSSGQFWGLAIPLLLPLAPVIVGVLAGIGVGLGIIYVGSLISDIYSRSHASYAESSSSGSNKTSEKGKITEAGTPNSKSWNEAKKKIKEGKGKGVNVKARNEEEAERLINEARPKLVKRPTYEANPPKVGYETHPIDNDYNMPHIKWRDWSNGKANGADGHIFWDK